MNILTTADASSVLTTDPTKFYNHLYTLLGRMSGVTIVDQDDKSENVKLTKLTQAYARSNTPAANAVNQFFHRSIITKDFNSLKSLKNDSESSCVLKNRITIQEAEQLTDIIVNCLNLLLIKRKREVSVNRALAFIKRLAGCVLSVVSFEIIIMYNIINLIYNYYLQTYK